MWLEKLNWQSDQKKPARTREYGRPSELVCRRYKRNRKLHMCERRTHRTSRVLSCCQEEQPMNKRKITPDSCGLLQKEKKRKKRNHNSKMQKHQYKKFGKHQQEALCGGPGRSIPEVENTIRRLPSCIRSPTQYSEIANPKKKQNDGKQSNERTEGNQTRGELQLSAAPKGL